MRLFILVLGSIFFSALGVGLAVLLTNPHRPQNRAFFMVSANLAAWTACVLGIVATHERLAALLLIRLASMVGVLIPVNYNLLCLVIDAPEQSLSRQLRRMWVVLTAAAFVILLCGTPLFMRNVVMPAGSGGGSHVPDAVYGPLFIIFALYFPLVLSGSITFFVRRMWRAQGIRRNELQFTLLGMATALPIAVIIHVTALALRDSTVQQFGPLCLIPILLLTAYGIATRRLMDVASFIRRVAAYSLQTIYLVAIYLVVWFLTDAVRRGLSQPVVLLPHILAAVAVAFSMAPAHGLMQRFAERLFINPGVMDISRTIQKASALLQTVTTLGDLLPRFSRLVSEAMGADRVILLVEDKGKFAQVPADQTPPLVFDLQSPLIRELTSRTGPLVADVIPRTRTSEQLQLVSAQMQRNEIAVALGVKSKGILEAVLLLGPRLSGRIYGTVEQDALQLICNQLAVALENARLYTQVQDGKIYNEILLDRLVSGVIAVNAEGLVSVFNREAQRVTRLTPDEVLHKPCQNLPPSLARALAALLEHDTPLGNTELVLTHGEETVTIRAGGALFKSHTGKTLGALLVFSDITDLKKMEIQVRRSDRLASLGTLSAGMAHEIKNPLVTLKTFSQLLPERYDDRDFRDTFSTLVGHEIQRIDSIVNQLLEFSRPAKPKLAPVSLHQVLEHSLKLVAEELRKNNIALICFLSAPRAWIMADSNQLSQVFLNLFLNAVESMDGDGQLTVATEVASPGGPAFNGRPESPDGEQIHVSIGDTGSGIKPEDMGHIFDPFFTTKNEGTGLGLSVAHGIIEEHGGLIDVISTVAKGTTFHIFFPLVSERIMNAASTNESATPMPAV